MSERHGPDPDPSKASRTELNDFLLKEGHREIGGPAGEPGDPQAVADRAAERHPRPDQALAAPPASLSERVARIQQRTERVAADANDDVSEARRDQTSNSLYDPATTATVGDLLVDQSVPRNPHPPVQPGSHPGQESAGHAAATAELAKLGAKSPEQRTIDRARLRLDEGQTDQGDEPPTPWPSGPNRIDSVDDARRVAEELRGDGPNRA